jgi:hypothetical protein
MNLNFNGTAAILTRELSAMELVFAFIYLLTFFSTATSKYKLPQAVGCFSSLTYVSRTAALLHLSSQTASIPFSV